MLKLDLHHYIENIDPNRIFLNINVARREMKIVTTDQKDKKIRYYGYIYQTSNNFSIKIHGEIKKDTRMKRIFTKQRSIPMIMFMYYNNLTLEDYTALLMKITILTRDQSIDNYRQDNLVCYSIRWNTDVNDEILHMIYLYKEKKKEFRSIRSLKRKARYVIKEKTRQLNKITKPKDEADVEMDIDNLITTIVKKSKSLWSKENFYLIKDLFHSGFAFDNIKAKCKDNKDMLFKLIGLDLGFYFRLENEQRSYFNLYTFENLCRDLTYVTDSKEMCFKYFHQKHPTISKEYYNRIKCKAACKLANRLVSSFGPFKLEY